MIYLVVDQNGAECAFDKQPYRFEALGKWVREDNYSNFIFLPKGSIEKLIGKKLTWDNEPFKYY